MRSGTRDGPRRSKTFAAPRWAGVAPPLGDSLPCQRRRRPFHRRHSRRHRQRHRRHRHPRPHRPRPHSRLPLRDLWIRTIVQWVRMQAGTPPRRSGAAGSTTSVMGIRHSRHPPQIPTTASTALRTGRLAGLWPRKRGAAGFMARAAQMAQVQAVDVLPSGLHLHPLTAKPDSPIG